MSIINSNRFKNKLRFSTQPSQMTEQTLNHNSYQKNAKIQPSSRYQKDTSYSRQLNKRQQAQQASFKPGTSQIVFLDTDKLETKVGIFGKQGKKRRNLKQLKLQLPKQLVQSKHLIKQMRRSLSKEGQSSIDSVRIHKIRSNLGIQAKKEYITNRQSFKPSRAYKFQEKRETNQQDKQQQKLIKTMLIEKGISKQVRNVTKKQVSPTKKIEEIKRQFLKLQNNIATINSHFNADNPYQCLVDSIKRKNKLAAIRIIFRVMTKNDPRLLLWKQEII